MTRLPRTLKQVARLWQEASPAESAFFQEKIEAATNEWAARQAAAEEPMAVNFATAKAKEETK